MMRWLFRLLSPGREKGPISIFIFHRVLNEPDPLLPWEPDRKWFEEIIGFIASTFTVVSLVEAVTLLQRGELPPATAVITFDDGYADNYSEALPILRRHGVAATFFIATGFLGGGRMWNDDIIEASRAFTGEDLDLSEFQLGRHRLSDVTSRIACYQHVLNRLKYYGHRERQTIAREISLRAGVPADCDLMLTHEELLGLRRAGMEIGAHTVTHPILNSVPDEEAESEIRLGRSQLERLLGEKVEVFAYPNGTPGRDYSPRHIKMVRDAGFVAAVSTAAGVVRSGGDLYQLPRFTPWDRDVYRFALRCAARLWRG